VRRTLNAERRAGHAGAFFYAGLKAQENGS
jgi:hypothetical protein